VHFKTLKYRPELPARFKTIEQARKHCRAFFAWYNQEHRHSGIGLMTPAAVHHGQAQKLHTARASVLEAAFTRNPERFVRKPPAPPALPIAAWINKPKEAATTH
jgi:putative transposase